MTNSLKKRTCSVEECTKEFTAKGLCRVHYMRVRRTGSTHNTRDHEFHNMSHTPEYVTWDSMIQRCENSKTTHYNRYGGRGISVCDEWRNSFVNFYNDMGSRPDGMSLDRINNNGNYEPSNCRWASAHEQRMNTGMRKDNTLGYRGIVDHKKGIKRYQARVCAKSIGYFSSVVEAYQARLNYLTITEMVKHKE